MVILNLIFAVISSALGEEPVPVIHVRQIQQDFEPDGDLAKPVWQHAVTVRMERSTTDGKPLPALASTVRALWTTSHLYLAFECPFTRLTVFADSQPGRERIGKQPGDHLWNRDVVEVFLNTDSAKPRVYAELQVSPKNEFFDQIIGGGRGAANWNSGVKSAVRVDEACRVWRVELRVPLKSLGKLPVKPGTQWRGNFCRKDHAHDALLAWRPTLKPTFHVPARFGVLEFVAAEK
jgi:hypothetical protein